MILSAKDVRASLVTQTSMNVWTKGLVHNVAETLDSLEKSLSRQSVHLAQALKEKNDALERLTSSMEETRQIAATTVKQAQEIDRLLASFNNTVPLKTYIESQAQVQRYAAEVVNLKKELAALRPPEPKFKVGQLAMPKNCVQRRALTLEAPKWNNDGNYWVYPTHGWGAYDEKDLRELTAQEKGE